MAPPRPRFVLRFLLSGAVLAGAACATPPTGRQPQPPSAYTVQQELGQRDVIQAGEEYARNNSLLVAEAAEAVEFRPNYWRVRFQLADKPGRLLELEFDELARKVTRAQEIEVIPGQLPPEGEGGEGGVPGAGEGRSPVP
ncbi:hypothetical protein [Myxococcus sp. RHSTA-1-4]|uniref:hypothetical protein n=1 Tax=Myxococcus sp. RHSTA-1-4 TaxID=2874601 RepID=UPI001CBC7A34|nr:hypothetical protein [Myxococcus sp. RHSTA-1-4]MBZ4416318.1 hypothetical protein [Myxococcus sp. RHSTA-1-4]